MSLTLRLCMMMLAGLATLLLGACQAPEEEGPKVYEALYPIQQKGLWGFIDKTGTVAVKPHLMPLDDTALLLDQLGFPETAYSVDGNTLTIPREFLSHPSLQEKFIALEREHVLGLHFDYVSGQVVMNSQRMPVKEFGAGDLILVSDRSGWGYMDKTGQVTIPFQFRNAHPFSPEGVAPVQLGTGVWTFINRHGKPVFDLQFETVAPFQDGMARAQTGPVSGFVSEYGNVALASQSVLYGNFSEGLASFEKDGQVGYLDKLGKTVIAPAFLKGKEFRQGLAPVKTAEGQWGYIDRAGNMVIAAGFDDAEPFSEGLAAVRRKDRYGFVNREGLLEIMPRYLAVGPFKEGLAPVKVKPRQWGYINPQGDMVIEPRFEWAYGFRGGLAPVETPDGLGYINPRGQYVYQPTQ